MQALSTPLRRLLETGGGTEHWALLEESADRGETFRERKWAVVAAHGVAGTRAVDFLLGRMASPDPRVRFYAVEGLAWVRGAERTRALEGVLRGLDDVDPAVRAIAATVLAVVAKEPPRAEAVLDRLRRETDAKAAGAMATAVLRMDPGGGAVRVRAATAAASEEVRRAAEEALAGG
jgi:hypothetical protein